MAAAVIGQCGTWAAWGAANHSTTPFFSEPGVWCLSAIDSSAAGGRYDPSQIVYSFTQGSAVRRLSRGALGDDLQAPGASRGYGLLWAVGGVALLVALARR